MGRGWRRGENRISIPFTPGSDCSGSVALYLGVETGTYNFTMSDIDVMVDTTIVTPPIGLAKPASVTSEGEVKAGSDFAILHNNQQWADAINKIYVNGVAIDKSLISVEVGKIRIAGSVIPSEGTYTIVFESTGYANTKVISQKVLPADGNEIGRAHV